MSLILCFSRRNPYHIGSISDGLGPSKDRYHNIPSHPLLSLSFPSPLPLPSFQQKHFLSILSQPGRSQGQSLPHSSVEPTLHKSFFTWAQMWCSHKTFMSLSKAAPYLLISHFSTHLQVLFLIMALWHFMVDSHCAGALLCKKLSWTTDRAAQVLSTGPEMNKFKITTINVTPSKIKILLSFLT